MSETPRRGFWALNAAQFFEALNDNAFKTMLSLWVVAGAAGTAQAGEDFALGSLLFTLPFLLFSAYAGALADRVSKRTQAVACKVAELVIMAASIPALASGHRPALFALLFLLGVHSAFFGPAKMGLLPELLDPRRLSWGNGLFSLAGFVAIIVGTALGGWMLGVFQGRLMAAGAVFVTIAALGLGASLLVPPVPAAGTKERFPTDPVSAFWKDIRFAAKDRVLFLCLLGVGFFWMIGSLVYSGVLLYGKVALHLSDTRVGLLLVATASGIGMGSVLAGKFSGDKVEMGLVPVGSLGMGLLSLSLVAVDHFYSGLAVLFLLGVMGGFFIVPLNAVIQSRAPSDSLGRMMALANVMSFLGILSATGLFRLFTGPLALTADGAAVATGLLVLSGTAYILTLLPSAFVRMFLLALTNSIYRIEVRGRENFPLKGPALLVCNHVSYVDPLLLSAAVHRPIRFLTWRRLYESKGVTWFFKLMNAIPIAPTDGPRKFVHSLEAARQALREGHVVCIFAEGAITRVAQMLGFRKGAELILRDLDVPVIPVHLDRVWGSIFSFAGREFLWKMPRKIPYPVTVSFGKPLPSTAKSHEIRQSVLDLSSEAFAHRIQGLLPLHRAFLRQAKQQWTHEAMADSSGMRLTYGKAVVGSAILARKLMKACPEEGPVAVLLPPCVPAALVNIALALARRVCVNLNYTLSRDMVDDILAQSEARRIITSRKMLEALKWDPDPRMVFLEDLGRPPKLAALAFFLLFRVLPVSLWERFFPGGRSRVGETATLMFTSGSTGVPKGVQLTHANLQANVQSCLEVFQLDREDTLVGVLPFFHSFGYMATIWFPLLGGVRVIYHRSPLEVEAVQRLIHKYQGTIALITPTLLAMWAKRWNKEAVKSLRFFVTGAEKLRESTAKEVEAKLGIPILEGYGCTELSPVACVNTLSVKDRHEFQEGLKPGKVGRPLPGVSVRVVDPVTNLPLPTNTPGLILVKGPNVMAGYWGMPEKTAEAVKDGWYVTGDIGTVDEEGFVEITDRLSRFSKIGGEMVPHILIEEKIQAACGEPDAKFFLASVPDVKKGEALVVLYHGYSGDGESLTAKLKESGLPPLWIPDRRMVFKLEEWPVLGTGKIDLGKAKEIARDLASKA
jgi:acyl-[acyl-carrier-protein]-phospholipid O-acyltransferase / long-chain-fatty-acid--[acyl-carrier-protein] ligase